MLLFWCIQEPRLVGVGVAWCARPADGRRDATVFGQHALAYAVLAYAAEYFRRRVLRFPLLAAGRAGGGLLLLCAALVLLVRVVGGAPLPALDVLSFGPLVGALLWPVGDRAAAVAAAAAASPAQR